MTWMNERICMHIILTLSWLSRKSTEYKSDKILIHVNYSKMSFRMTPGKTPSRGAVCNIIFSHVFSLTVPFLSVTMSSFWNNRESRFRESFSLRTNNIDIAYTYTKKWNEIHMYEWLAFRACLKTFYRVEAWNLDGESRLNSTHIQTSIDPSYIHSLHICLYAIHMYIYIFCIWSA